MIEDFRGEQTGLAMTSLLLQDPEGHSCSTRIGCESLLIRAEDSGAIPVEMSKEHKVVEGQEATTNKMIEQRTSCKIILLVREGAST